MIFLRPMSRQKSSPAVDEMTTASILEYFAAVPDPRIDRRRLHPLTSILALSLVAVICGADSFVAIEEFGESKEAWLKTFLDFPNKIPSHDTLGRVFAILDPVALAEAFREWMRAVAGLTQGGWWRSTERRCVGRSASAAAGLFTWSVRGPRKTGSSWRR